MDNHLNGIALRYLEMCQGKTAKLASSDHERTSLLQDGALNSSVKQFRWTKWNPDPGLEYAKHRNMLATLKCAKDYIKLNGGFVIEGWRLFSLVLSAQGRYRSR
jgi:hypothetical protein